MVKRVSAGDVEEDYKQIKREVFELLRDECAKLSLKEGSVRPEKMKRSSNVEEKGEEQSVSF
jgi:hypothetical protein